MDRREKAAGGAGGFTLLEVLVVLAVVLTSGAALAPGVLGYLEEGRARAAAAQLAAVAHAAQRFRLDLGRVPGSLTQLVDPPGSGGATAVDVEASPIPAAAARAWRGPYLDVGAVGAEGLAVAGSGRLLPRFEAHPWGGDRFLAFRVSGVEREAAARISRVVDGDTLLSPGDAVAGRVRWTPAPAGGDLLYLAAPLP